MERYWIEWKGGDECPVGPDTIVEVKLRSNDRLLPSPAHEFGWLHYGSYLDVVAYRVVGQEPTEKQVAGAILEDYRSELCDVWETLETPVLYVVDENGVNVEDAQVRHLGGEYWLYCDSTDGYAIVTSDEVVDWPLTSVVVQP